MFQTILVPLDGTEIAERALPLAKILAGAVHGRILLIRSVWTQRRLDVSSGSTTQRKGEAERYLGEIAGRLHAEGFAETTVSFDPPAEGILAEVESRMANLIVMSTHGRTGLNRLRLGSVAEEVSTRSPVPVLFAGPLWNAESLPPIDRLRVLVPLDGTKYAEEVLPEALSLSAALHASMVLVQAITPLQGRDTESARKQRAEAEIYLNRVAKRCVDRGIHTRAIVREGLPSEAIVDAARSVRPLLIAMATHGRSGLDRVLSGSVAMEVLRLSPVPVLVTCPLRTAIMSQGLKSESQGDANQLADTNDSAESGSQVGIASRGRVPAS